MEFIKTDDVITAGRVEWTGYSRFFTTSWVAPFYVVAYCWYEGFKFAIGSEIPGKITAVMEVSTGAYGVTDNDSRGKKHSLKSIWNLFLKKANSDTRILGLVIDQFNYRNIGEVALWKLSVMF